ncbi:MAG: type II secretion system secretin GspD [bacterium]
MKSLIRSASFSLAMLLGLTGCESLTDTVSTDQPFTGAITDYRPVKIDTEGDGEEQAGKDGVTDQEAPSKRGHQLYPGTDRFVAAPKTAGKDGPETERNITLNFENTDIREVVKVVLGDMLQVGYLLDPAVRGGVTMQTGRPLAREELLPTLETLLRMNNAAVVQTGDIYRVLPVTKANRGTLIPQLADAATPLPAGYRVIVVPLNYISVTEMSKILQPLVLDGSIVRADSARNMLVLAGSGLELNNILDTINTFDVDWIKGLSVGFFKLNNAKVEDINNDLNSILGGEEALGNLVRVTPVKSANGILVVTPRKAYLEQVAEWIDRLDNLGTSAKVERLHVYRVKNGTAEELADLLNQLFQSQVTKTREAELAPGLQATRVGSSTVVRDTKGESNPTKLAEKKSVASTKTTISGSLNSGLEADIRIVADSVNNTLLVMATPGDYERIKEVLKELDVVPLQVHIEATIVEVLLDGDLKYGLQWFFKGSAGDYDSFGSLDGTNDGDSSGLGTIFPGFNWSLIDSGLQVRAVLSAFAGDSLVNVLSAPSVMVLDNHEASIQVGDEVPTITSQQQGTTEDSRVLNSIQYRDTGVLLTVKPRVNPGGLVTMEISQEVSAVAESAASSSSPIIQTRNIQSTVAVQSGQTVVLGGLIRNEQSEGQGGVPGLYNAPVIGPLFGETRKATKRTELVVVLTPTVIANKRDANAITEDFRERLKGLKGSF